MDDLKKIVLLQLEDVRKRLKKEGKELVISESAIETIAKNGYSEEYGARNISREIRRSALDKIAELALHEDYSKARRIVIDSFKGKITVELEMGSELDAEYSIDLFEEDNKG
jgi:ATPases with chaperone activity, ATP-binding subunit